MANPIFFGVDLSIPTYAWKTSAGADNVNASFPVSNLKNYYSDIVSKANSTGTDQYFVIDMGSAVSCDTLLLDGINFTGIADTSVKLQGNTNDDTTWEDPVDVATITQSNAAQIHTFSAASKRYWRILFNSSAPLSAAPQLGNIFLGTRITMGTTPWWPFTHNQPDFAVQTSRALDGRLRFAQSVNINAHFFGPCLDFRVHLLSLLGG
jgi:hypothetical protein